MGGFADFVGNDFVRRVGPLLSCDALFNTYCFLFVFLPVILAGYWLVPNRRWKLLWLTASSLVFYSLWDWRFVPLLVATGIVDFVFARRIAGAEGAARKRWMVANVTVALSSLAVFKYAMFAADNARGLLDVLGVGWTVPDFTIVLPIGISFFTFHSISYAVDVYKKDVEATRDFWKYLGYMTMFPQLVAGPIVRYAVMDRQLDALPRRPALDAVASGIAIFAMGLAKKAVLADSLAPHADAAWAEAGSLSMAQAWLGMAAYTLQLYFDFSGYSDMAIGLGSLLGLRFPVNFNAPYQALDPSDFWRRWHISLSTFLRDYLYIPLGGNRHGERRTQFNLLAVMVLGGLWHGASWTFAAWGLYHGLLLVAHRRLQRPWAAMPIPVQRGLMLLLAMFGWVFFRSPDFATAAAFFGDLFAADTLGGALLATSLLEPALLVVSLLAFTQVVRATAVLRIHANTWWGVLVATYLFASLLAMGSGQSPFLYYQF